MSRVAWAIDHGQEIPSGMWILHTCDNRRCIEGSHLYLGTRADNVADMVRRNRTGRRRHPESWTAKSYPMHFAKLDWASVDAIRAAHAEGAPYRELAARYQVSPYSIGRVVRGETWRAEARP